jgi:hypothetical protein
LWALKEITFFRKLFLKLKCAEVSVLSGVSDELFLCPPIYCGLVKK